jgi:hypothetical protein
MQAETNWSSRAVGLDHGQLFPFGIESLGFSRPPAGVLVYLDILENRMPLSQVTDHAEQALR